jgi:4a-hydroxytetrahydrobiopterin dehydratase
MSSLGSYQKRSSDNLTLKGARNCQQKTLRLGSSQSASPAPRLLSEKELQEALSHLRGWSRQSNKLHRQFHFSSFEQALGFLSGLALVAQAAGHPLEESELYDCVVVNLTTPEVGGIADIDVELAWKANALALTITHKP